MNPQPFYKIKPIQTAPAPVVPAPVKKYYAPVKKKKSKAFIYIVVGILIGILLSGAFVYSGVTTLFYTNGQCSKIAEDISKTYYSLGAFHIMNHTRATGNLLYLENGTILETSIAAQCDRIK